MSHKHETLLRTIFHDPPSGNLHWREVESLLNHVGAKIDNLPGARLHVTINGQEAVLHRPHHNNVLDRQGIKSLREYLARAGVTVSALEKA
ncbi:MAG TPA: type II toxin-antitoxin system HicA family toxin [Rhodocyclaceae bacterium]|nr:type II toxin-antitoxin system HicA family toxin [Rhodocyclaceae bacterium]